MTYQVKGFVMRHAVTNSETMLTFTLLALVITGSNGALQFASYYQDHMVLQRGPQQAVIWGHATKIGDGVTVQVSNHGSVIGKVTKDAAGHGMWKVKLPAITARGPFTVTATSSEGTVIIKDVLFGDVWICSGQSNMGFTTGNVMNHTAELVTSLTFTNIRVFKARTVQSNTTLLDFGARSISSVWSKPTTASITSFSAVCWLFGEYLYADRKYPIGLVESAWGGTPIETWSSPDAISQCTHHANRRAPKTPSVLWNSMINPLLSMTIYGSLWYQGESNAAHPGFYACQFPAMINDWRTKFHDASLGETSDEFPFGFVQLAGHRQTTAVGTFPGLRYAQTVNHGFVPNARQKNVFMAVAMDLPDFKSPYGSIHPRDKQDVARRLVLGARAVAYHEQGVKYQGPFPKSLTNNKGTHTLNIVYQWGPISVQSNNGFEVCCSTSTTCGAHDHWVPATIHSHSVTAVELSTTRCGNNNTVGVRYAWRESPCDFKQCAIYGRDTSLPAPPYLYKQGFESGPHIIGK